MAFVLALWILILVIQLATWAWPVTVGLFGMAIVASLIWLAGRRGRIMRHQAAEMEVVRQNALSQLGYARREAEGQMWEEFGRQLRGGSR